VGFEPTRATFEQAKTVHASDRAATVIADNDGGGGGDDDDDDDNNNMQGVCLLAWPAHRIQGIVFLAFLGYVYVFVGLYNFSFWEPSYCSLCNFYSHFSPEIF
jgi:hypothetical protein